MRNKYQRKDRKSNHKFEEAMVVDVFHFTDQIEIASGLYAQRAARLLPSPPGGEFFPTPGTDAVQFR